MCENGFGKYDAANTYEGTVYMTETEKKLWEVRPVESRISDHWLFNYKFQAENYINRIGTRKY